MYNFKCKTCGEKDIDNVYFGQECMNCTKIPLPTEEVPKNTIIFSVHRKYAGTDAEEDPDAITATCTCGAVATWEK